MAVTSTQRKAMMMLLLLALDMTLVAASPLPILNQTASWTRARRESEELTEEEIIEWQIDRLGVQKHWLSAETIAEANAVFEDMKAFDKTLSRTYEGGWRLSQHYADLGRNVGALCRAGVWDEVETETKIFYAIQTEKRIGLMQQLQALALIEVTGNCLDVARQLANDLAEEVILPGNASDVQRQTRSLQTLHDVTLAGMYGVKKADNDFLLSLFVKIATELKVNSSMIEFLLKISSLDVIWLLQDARGHRVDGIIHLYPASGLLPRLQVRAYSPGVKCEFFPEEETLSKILSFVPIVGGFYQLTTAVGYAAAGSEGNAECQEKAAKRAIVGAVSIAVDVVPVPYAVEATLYVLQYANNLVTTLDLAGYEFPAVPDWVPW